MSRTSSRPCLAVLLSAVAALACAAPAVAAPQAPGAPGDKHTWAPADKHGFSTARQLAGNAYLTLRQASPSEIYYPDLSTPALPQPAVRRHGRHGVRSTARPSRATPATSSPSRPACARGSSPCRGTLRFRQVTETARWQLTKTWLTDPDRATVIVHVRFRSKTGRRCASTCSPIPRPATTATTTAALSERDRLVAYDDTAASVVAARPALSQTTQRLPRQRERPVEQPRRTTSA